MHLVLFFTYGNSLRTWYEHGILERECAIYKHLIASGHQVSFVTYGNRSELDFQSDIPDIHIACNRWNLKFRLYVALLPLLYFFVFRSADILKTNQTHGGHIALRVARLYRKPLIARCGFMFSEFKAYEFSTQDSRYQQALAYEQNLFSKADRVVVTTPMMRNDIVHRMRSLESKIRVIPNYVDTSHFSKNNSIPKRFDFIFIGRFTEQKNLHALLSAIKQTDYTILVVGNGILKQELMETYGSNQIIWQDRVPNTELPKLINSAKCFILPSLYEGHPKVLIEAMACGVPVIGTKVPGIQELIEHGKNGLLCDTNSESIKLAIEHIMTDEHFTNKLGNNALCYAYDYFSLGKIVDQELTVYQELLK